MRIGLAQTQFPHSAADGLTQVIEQIEQASQQNCDLICFPESIIPGLRGVGYEVEDYDHKFQQSAIAEVREHARQAGVAVILPMEWQDELGLHLVAFVIDEQGELLGYQTKNQIDPGEDFFGYVAGEGRHLFEFKQIKFGIVICHEGWRYPETVRWAAVRGASIVFHPQFTGDVDNPEFYNQAMIGRSTENNIYFASVNYALDNQKSSSALISPLGERLCAAPLGEEALLVYDIDPSQATRLLASRFRADLL
ncbi:carbon-nitrogen hydrolase family protein [Paenibacillus lupini]|uniref:carbon-nitrogen hydrolase family protein n=1 Tax=Paenibacillus lupini TaxID=1450204 RepID=UPI001421E18D|nr:carbon-nitrogen hydrolase family protein [Paenibacillus lupini]NIK21241.1 ribosomal-protein-alanine N-acetyltransferase [Paenibacillus lupini]